MTKHVLVVLFICAVCVNSDEDFFGRYKRVPEYWKIKAKYYSNPPMRIHRKPPMMYPVKGIFSYTPPPNYMAHADVSSNLRPKVSKRQPEEGLEYKDIMNIVNNLSKHDLDRVIELADEKYRNTPHEKHTASFPKYERDTSDISTYKATGLVEQETFTPHEKYSATINKYEGDTTSDISAYKVSGSVEQEILPPSSPSKYIGHSNYELEFNSDNRPSAINNGFKPMGDVGNFLVQGSLPNVHDDSDHYQSNGQGQVFQSSQPFDRPQYQTDVPLNAEETNKNQFTLMDAYIQQELYGSASDKDSAVTYTDSKVTKEETLPKPINLREDEDYLMASSNRVRSAVSPHSYKLENFGDLPLMDYNSKLHTVSSYHVPHYSVISPPSGPSIPPAPSIPLPSYSSSLLRSSASAASVKVPPLEPAPPASAAKEQSDAHLKATKIWTHHSGGTAYTLHDDGTLSLEKPGRKPVYGP